MLVGETPAISFLPLLRKCDDVNRVGCSLGKDSMSQEVVVRFKEVQFESKCVPQGAVR